jgi:hypothetical protein
MFYVGTSCLNLLRIRRGYGPKDNGLILLKRAGEVKKLKQMEISLTKA